MRVLRRAHEPGGRPVEAAQQLDACLRVGWVAKTFRPSFSGGAEDDEGEPALVDGGAARSTQSAKGRGNSRWLKKTK